MITQNKQSATISGRKYTSNPPHVNGEVMEVHETVSADVGFEQFTHRQEILGKSRGECLTVKRLCLDAHHKYFCSALDAKQTSNSAMPHVVFITFCRQKGLGQGCTGG